MIAAYIVLHGLKNLDQIENVQDYEIVILIVCAIVFLGICFFAWKRNKKTS